MSIGKRQGLLGPRDTTAWRPMPERAWTLWVIPIAAGTALILAGVALGPLMALGVVVAAVLVVATLRWFPEFFVVAVIAAGPFANSPVVSSIPAAVSLSFVGLTVAILLALWTQRGSIEIPAAVWPFAVLVLLIIAGSLYSPDPSGGVSKSLTFQTLSVISFLAPIVLIRNRASFRRLLLGIAGVGVVASLVAVDGGHASRPLVLPGSDNEIALGLLAGLGLVALIGYFWAVTPGPWRLLLLIPVWPVLATTLGAGSRGALLGTVAGLLVAVIALLVAVPSARRAVGGLLLILLLAAPIVWVSTPPDARDKYSATLRSAQQGGGAEAGGDERAGFASAAVDLFRDNPMGVGTNGFPGVTGLQYPHNIILELGAELGVFGIAVFLWLVAAVIVAVVRRIRSGIGQSEAIGALALLMVPLVLSLSSFDLNQNRALWVMLGLAVASASLAPARRQDREADAERRPLTDDLATQAADARG